MLLFLGIVSLHGIEYIGILDEMGSNNKLLKTWGVKDVRCRWNIDFLGFEFWITIGMVGYSFPSPRDSFSIKGKIL